MSPRARLAALPAVILLACGDGSSDSSFSASNGQPSASDSSTDATAAQTTTTGIAVPTTGDSAATPAGPTTSDDTTTSATTSTSTSTSTTPDDTTSTSTGPVDPGTSTTSDDTTSTTSDDTTTTSDDTTGPVCPEGTEGCPCGPGDTCNNGLQCQADTCTDVPVCGDGDVEGNEACDDGDQNSNTGACKLDCTKQTCGDGHTGPGEACDNGGQNSNTGACKLDCTKQTCGDGYTGPGEACDDGNGQNGDGCEANCTKTPVAQDACGNPGDGLWVQIDYGNANSVTNPTWTYGGWTESQWAPTGNNWPYINAIGGVTLNQDQGVIGKVAGLYGTNKYIRVFIGLGGLVDYDHATACVEGRSYNVGSSVTFRVENALNDCGGQGVMSNDWLSLHPTNVDLGSNCFIPGNDFQAVEVRPIGGSGSLSLKRMRVTFHGAVY